MTNPPAPNGYSVLTHIWKWIKEGVNHPFHQYLTDIQLENTVKGNSEKSRMGKNKQVLCKVCYREMRSDVLARHMKQHSMRNESSPVTNISVTNNYNTISGASTERKDEENENKDEELKKYLIKIENEYQEKLVQGKKIYKMLGEGVVSYQALCLCYVSSFV